MRFLFAALLSFTLPASAQERDATDVDVTVYRCVGGDGSVALRDSPCPAGETQQVRSMLKPKDAPPVPIAAAPAPTVENNASPRPPPQKMYECTNAETGAPYISDDGSGNPRWIDDTTYTYVPTFAPSRGEHPHDGPAHGAPPVYPPPPKPGTPIWQGHPQAGRVPDMPPPRPRYAGGGGVLVPVDNGHMVHDTCHALPHAEACSRLRGRNSEIASRYGVASHDERAELDREQDTLLAQLQTDCGT